MVKSYELPEFKEILELLLPLEVSLDNRTQTIDDWRKEYLKDVYIRRKQSKIEIFKRFVSALLERVTPGKNYLQRIETMNRYINNSSDITEDKIRRVLEESKYRFKESGLHVVLQAKLIIDKNSFQWENYFLEAERNYENGYLSDSFLRIRGVKNKVRDFAISEFSTSYCAIDRHISEILLRTGLILHGYGSFDFGANPSEKKDYGFLRKLLIGFAKQTGWQPSSNQGFSPGEIDRILWLFGQSICKRKPKCDNCPIRDVCLTFKNRYIDSIK